MHYLRGVALRMGLVHADYVPVIDLLTAMAIEQNERYESFKASWEQARIISYYAGLGNFKKGTKPKSLMKFPWETGSLTIERIKEVNEIMKNDKRFPDRL